MKINRFKLVFIGKLISICFFIAAPSIVLADYGVEDFGKPLEIFKGLSLAENLFPQKKDGTSYYYSIPDSATFFGKKVEIKSYGFESEKLCMLGFGYGSLGEGQIDELIFQINKEGHGFKSEDNDMSGGRRIYFESEEFRASLYLAKMSEVFEVRFAVSSLKCDKSIAKNIWQTMRR